MCTPGVVVAIHARSALRGKSVDLVAGGYRFDAEWKTDKLSIRVRQVNKDGGAIEWGEWRPANIKGESLEVAGNEPIEWEGNVTLDVDVMPKYKYVPNTRVRVLRCPHAGVGYEETARLLAWTDACKQLTLSRHAPAFLGHEPCVPLASGGREAQAQARHTRAVASAMELATLELAAIPNSWAGTAVEVVEPYFL